MRYDKTHKEKTRIKILDAALQEFRFHGYHGIGVDGIAKAAGVTSGAFYSHFKSKSDLFRSVIIIGISQLREHIDNIDSDNNNSLYEFINWYFSTSSKRQNNTSPTKPMEGGCALPSLSTEIVRADKKTQLAFQKELNQILKILAPMLDQNPTRGRQKTWTILSLMVGGISLSRSVQSPSIAKQISEDVLSSIQILMAEEK